MDARTHWETVYRSKAPTEVSWYQRHAAVSLDLIQRHAPDPDAPILNVGAGVPVLHGELLAAGYTTITAIDISAAALELARTELGDRASLLRWIEGSILEADLPEGGVSVWHDRAVFHFLTDPTDRATYMRQLRRAVAPGGLVILATFAEDGPTRCSGLEVRRYSAATLHEELGAGFLPVAAHREEHRTPSGSVQLFQYLVARRG